jgi:hypothetical protein
MENAVAFSPETACFESLGLFADALPATTPEESFDPETFDGNIGAN